MNRIMKISGLSKLVFALVMVLCTSVFAGQVPGNSGIPGISSSPVSEKTWKKINMAIQAEDWKNLARLSSESLPKYTKENNLEQAYLRYLHIWSTMGIYRDKLATAEIVQVKLDIHKGKVIMFPHKFKCKDGQVPNNCYGNTEDNQRLLIKFTNFKEDFTHIEAKIATQEKPNLSNYMGKDIYVFGTMEDMKLSPQPVDVGIYLSVTGATIFQVGSK